MLENKNTLKLYANLERISFEMLEENSIRNRCKIFTYMPVFTTLSGWLVDHTSLLRQFKLLYNYYYLSEMTINAR